MTVITFYPTGLVICSTIVAEQRRIRSVKHSLKLWSRISSVTAFGLIAWCAGAGCLAATLAHDHSASVEAAATDLRGLTSSAEAGTACHAQHHQMKRSRDSAPADDSVEVTQPYLPASEANSCCPLMSASFVTAANSHDADDNTAVPARNSSFSCFSLTSYHAPATSSLRLPSPDQTYLRVCSFLI